MKNFSTAGKALLAAAAAGSVVMLAACGSSGGQSGAALEGQASAQIEKTFELNQPFPTFAHSVLRATAIQIEAIQALGEQTTSFAMQQGDPDPIWSCPSLGMPVPVTDQLSNPQQIIKTTVPYRGGAAVTIGNMEPNGVYTGDSAGTYVLCVGSNGKPYAHYWEGYVDAVSAAAVWDYKKHQVVVTGAPQMPTCTVQTVGIGTKAKAETVCKK